VSRAEAGEIALRALEHLAAAARIGTFTGLIQAETGEAFNGPHVTEWAVGAALADQALTVAGSRIPAPFPRPVRGLIPPYYRWEEAGATSAS
jgi:hypothetical protein